MKRFRALLSAAGIQLVLEGVDDVDEGELSDVRGDPDPELDHEQFEDIPARGRRRASFNDSNLDETWISGERFLRHQSVDEMRGRQSLDERDGRYHLMRRHRARSASVTRDERLIAEDRAANTRHNLDYETGGLAADATFLRSGTLARRFLWLWHARTLQTRRRQSDLSHIARNHDRRILLKQSFAQMRDSAFDSQFWSQQERRATRARNLFLLTKAFTHWAQTASEEVFRTNVARRHILRTRYFNAWRDITVVNELKCRRLGLRKWFDHWRNRSERHDRNIEAATVFNETKLLERTYWTWFWTFCEKKAPVWKEFRLKSGALDLLRQRLAARSSSTLAAHGVHNRVLQMNALRTLREQVAMQTKSEESAMQFRERHLLASAFGAMCRKLQYDPRQLTLRRDSSKRIQRQALIIWHESVIDVQLARQVDRRRLLNNAWTAWNDRLRCRTLQLKIDDRILTQSLYTWVLEERLVLFERVMHHRQKGATLERLSVRIAERQFQLGEASQLFEANVSNRAKRAALTRLNQVSRTREHSELAATEFRNARDLPRAFQVWKEKSSHTMHLARWAVQARFYCLASGAIKRWKQATSDAQKQRRREAYVAVRRRQKMDLARRCLMLLQSRLHGYQSLQAQAEQLRSDNKLRVTRDYFDVWRDKFRLWQSDNALAEATIGQYRLGDALSAMILRLSEMSDRESQAAIMARETLDRIAGRMFRRLSDTVFVLRRQIDTAQAWQDRKFNQHRKEMIRYWAVRTTDRRATRNADDPESPTKTSMSRLLRRSRRNDTSLDMAATARTQDVSEYSVDLSTGEDVDFSFGATPLPGYLRTPSRRTARARSRFKTIPERSAAIDGSATTAVLDFGSSVIGSTTPAPFAPGNVVDMETLTPQVTPFQRKMRAGGFPESTTPFTAPRSAPTGGRFGASARPRDTGRTVRFGDGLEDEGSLAGEELESSPSRR